MSKPSVLFVSKAITPPFHDGTKCLVRDLAQHLTRFEPRVMSSPGAPPLSGVTSLPVYGDAGGFSPGLLQNARAASYLVLRAQADLWHFVFAPNPASSHVGRVAKYLRKAPVVQTIASPPLSFRGASNWLFGDVVVAQSKWTARQLSNGARGQEIEVIPPCVGAAAEVDAVECAAVRQSLSIPSDAPIFLYPGDLETSSGAQTVADAVAPILAAIPAAFVVFACRKKSPAAPRIEADLRARLSSSRARFAGELRSVLPLLKTSRVLLFPVDDLRGKVDLPIVLLEAMQLGTPVVVAAGGPLDDLEHVLRVPAQDPAALVAACRALHEADEVRLPLVKSAQLEVDRQFSARSVAARYETVYERLLRLTA